RNCRGAGGGHRSGYTSARARSMTTTLQSQPTQLRPGRPWRVVLFGAACVGAGLWCGLLLRSEPRVWHAGDAQPGELKLAPPSFADIVAKVGAGVVTVRAEFDPQGEGEEASATDKPTAPPPPTGTAAGHTAGEPS